MRLHFPWPKQEIINQEALRPAPEDYQPQNPQSGLLSGTLSTKDWEGLLENPFPGQDLTLFAEGSIGKTIPYYLQAIHWQGIENTNLAQASALFTTPEDLMVVRGRLWTPEDYVIRSRTQGSNTFTAHLPNRATLKAAVWQTLENYVGCASDPEFAVEVLQTDPLALESLHGLVEATLVQLQQHNLMGGASSLELLGFGGSYPLGDAMYGLFSRQLHINRRNRLLFLGCPWQYKNRRIARSWLAHYLSEPIPENTILYLVSLDSPGSQRWDPCLACGILTVTATDRKYGQPDAATIFKRLRERGDIVEVKAQVIPIPLRRLERKTRLGRVEVHHVLLGSPVPALLAALKRRVKEFPCDYRLAVFVGDLREKEIEQLQKHAQMISPYGQIEVLVNTLKPLTHGEPRVADYYFVDFAVPSGQPPSLLKLASDNSSLPARSNGVGRAELVKRLGSGNGSYHAAAIEKAVEDILARHS